MANKTNIRLANPRNVQSFLKKIINQYYADEIDATKSRNLGYLAKILLDSFEIVEFEQRLAELESKQSDQGGNNETRD